MIWFFVPLSSVLLDSNVLISLVYNTKFLVLKERGYTESEFRLRILLISGDKDLLGRAVILRNDLLG